MRHNHGDYGRTFRIDEDLEVASYFDSIEFKRYTARVGEIIAASKSPITIASIHAILGERIMRHWTMDSLELLTDVIEPVNEVSPLRYRVKSKLMWQAFTRSETNAHLFGKSRKYLKVYAFEVV